MSKSKILIIDDDPDILEFISYNLIKEGFQTITASNGRDAIGIAKREIPHLIIIDVMMPEMDGVETCYHLRDIPSLKNTLILFLSARSEDYSQIAGFDAGADDYVTKPIKPRLLISRIRALLKRHQPEIKPQSVQHKGSVKIDRERYLVIKDEDEISMPKKEFELIALLMSNPGKVFTRDNILDTIWGGDVVVGDRTIDVHVRKLREKLGESVIKTIKGVGYKFMDS